MSMIKTTAALTNFNAIIPDTDYSTGLCVGRDPMWWDTDASSLYDQQQAASLCGECPLKETCYNDAATDPANNAFGTIRGGYRWVFDGDGGRGLYPQSVPDEWTPAFARSVCRRMDGRNESVLAGEASAYLAERRAENKRSKRRAA